MTEPKPDWLTPEVRDFLRQLSYDYQVRVFSEEIARVNLLPLEERKAYIYAKMDEARRN